jgi:hypothetical protein
LRVVNPEPAVLIPWCAECKAVWLPADENRWRVYLGSDGLDETPEVALYCPECAEQEFK